MVRPRASEENIGLAVAFADVVIVKTVSWPFKSESTVLVARKGRQSVFAALASCFPDLVRDSGDKRPKNRNAVSQMELNKALQSAGLKSMRKRDRAEGGVRWRCMVFLKSYLKGHQQHCTQACSVTLQFCITDTSLVAVLGSLQMGEPVRPW